MTAPAPLLTPGISQVPSEKGQFGRVEVRFGDEWVPVCPLDRLTPGRGLAALLPDGSQIAVFSDRTGAVYAIGNRDPFTGAYVLSRGLLGSVEGRPFVASPLLKQRFALADGRCLDEDGVSVPAYRARTRVPGAA